MEIVMARGDLEPQTFVVTEDGQPPEEPFDDIFFTVKKLPKERYSMKLAISTAADLTMIICPVLSLSCQ